MEYVVAINICNDNFVVKVFNQIRTSLLSHRKFQNLMKELDVHSLTKVSHSVFERFLVVKINGF